MKKLVTVLLLVSVIAVHAQERKGDRKEMRKELREKMKDFTPQQMADLRVKKLTLALDLNESQQTRLLQLETDKAVTMKSRMENRKKRSELSSEELYEAKKNRLDAQIAYKKELKSILTEAQFEKWEKGRKGKRGMKKRRQGHKKR
tara:strand:+ start:6324 stop:6761 length:438 start_codon:yes stop_codon:yes gene_type:complete